MMHMKILVTGFEPFGGEAVNPAWEAVKRLPDAIAGAEIVKLEIPTVFSRCGGAVEEGIRACRPDAVLCVGQAGGRACVSVERVAINLAEAGIPDNAGEQPVDRPLQPGGPAAYFATVPVKAMVRSVRDHGIPCQLSYSAGTYVCNCVMYQTLHLAATRYPNIRAGFIHVPFATEQAVGKAGNVPSASLETIAQALEHALEAVAAGAGDPEGTAMGTTH